MKCLKGYVLLVGLLMTVALEQVSLGDTPPAGAQPSPADVQPSTLSIPKAAAQPSPVGIQPSPAPKADISVLGLTTVPEVWAAGETVFLLGKTATRADGPKSIKWIVTPKERGDRSVSLIDPTLGPILCLSPGPHPIVITITQIVTLGDDIDSSTITITFLSDNTPSPTPPGPRPPTPTPISSFTQSLLSITSFTPETKNLVSSSFNEAINPAPASVEELTARTTSAITKKVGVDRFLKEIYPWRAKFTELVDKTLPTPIDGKPIPLSAYIKLWEETAKALETK